MNYPVYDIKGKEISKTLLPKEIFNIEINQNLIHEVAVMQASNRRQGSAKTKDRSEVRGGGKKPWRQKGTGRARHGSTRSPIWKGGGVTFGPTGEKNFKKKINKKVKKKALFMTLSLKAKENCLILLDSLEVKENKTKIMVDILKRLPMEKRSAIVALPQKNNEVLMSSRNISGIIVSQAKDLNVLDLLSYKYLIMPKESIKSIKEVIKE